MIPAYSYPPNFQDHYIPIEARPSKKDKRRQFWQKIGQKYEGAGGAAGIGSTIDSLVGLVRGNRGGGPGEPGLEVNPGIEMKLGPAPEPEKKKVPVVVWVIGGVLVLGVGAWGLGLFTPSPTGEVAG